MHFWPRTLRARLTVWYTAVLCGMLALLGTTSLVLLDRGLHENVDASLKSVARSIAESTRRASPFGRSLDETLEALLNPGFPDRFFRLLDPFGRPDPRLLPRSRVELPLNPEALHNAAEGREMEGKVS